jgi:hypothetical protein
MNTVSTKASEPEWVPLTPEIFDLLFVKYCDWGSCLTEIRERIAALREETRIAWKPPSDIEERLNDLNERDGLYAAKHMPTARAFLDAAEADAAATKPHRLAHIERLKERIAALEKAYEDGWPKRAKFTKEEHSGWFCMVWGMRFNACFIDETEVVVRYFEEKLLQLHRYEAAYEAAKQDYDRFRGLNQKPKMQLGLKLLGKKGRGK